MQKKNQNPRRIESEEERKRKELLEKEDQRTFGCLDATAMKANHGSEQPGPKLTEVSVVQSPALACTEGVTSMDQNIANNANFMHSIGSCDNLVTLPILPSSSTVLALMKGHTFLIMSIDS